MYLTWVWPSRIGAMKGQSAYRSTLPSLHRGASSRIQHRVQEFQAAKKSTLVKKRGEKLRVEMRECLPRSHTSQVAAWKLWGAKGECRSGHLHIQRSTVRLGVWLRVWGSRDDPDACFDKHLSSRACAGP